MPAIDAALWPMISREVEAYFNNIKYLIRRAKLLSILGIENKFAGEAKKGKGALPAEPKPIKKTRTRKKKAPTKIKHEHTLFIPKRDPNFAKLKSSSLTKSEAFGLTGANHFRPYHYAMHPTEAPPGLSEALDVYEKSEVGAGGIGTDFPQGDIGQPFWFSNIGGNHFPREGFTYRPFDTPIVVHKEQLKGYFDDEDARMGVDFLAAKTTGGDHYFTAKTKFLAEYVESWTKEINLNGLIWKVAKELLAFGNSFVRLRVPIWQAKRPDDFQMLPIESMVRIWWTPDRRPLWYEFRGAEYNGYFRPGEVIHFQWNQTNGQIFGFGIMAQLTNRVSYLEDTPDGPIVKERESYLDIKHGLQNVSYKVMKRYLPRLVIDASKAGEETRDAIREEMRVLHDSEDIVHGITGLKTTEIGTQTRPIDPQAFMDLFQSSIFKAVQTSKGRIAGQSQGPSYANGEESAILDEVGMSQFPIQLRYMIENYIVKPWYESHRIVDDHIFNGIIAVPWKAGHFELNFGKQSKKDLEPEQVAQWVQILQSAGQIAPSEIRKVAEYVGVPELASDAEGAMNEDLEGVSGGQVDGGVPLNDAANAMKNNPTGGPGANGDEGPQQNVTPGPQGQTPIPENKSKRSRA